MRGTGRRSLLGIALGGALTPYIARAQTAPRSGAAGGSGGQPASAPGTTAPAAGSEGAQDPRQPIQEFYTALLAGMKDGQTASFEKRFDALAPVIDRVFDLETILKVSVGPRWASIDEEARKTLFDVFRRFTIASYVSNFDKYDGEKLDVLPDMRPSGADRIVASRIVPAKGDPVSMDYLMRQGPDGWRVVDVLLQGTISRVAVQRSDFRALLSKGDTAALLASLRQKTRELSGGAFPT